MQTQLEKQGKRLEGLKSGGQGYGKKNKKADRLELQLKEQVTKALASLRLKQAVVVSVKIIFKFRVWATPHNSHAVFTCFINVF